MGRYNDLFDLMIKTELSHDLERLDKEEIQTLRNEFEGIPEDYLDFLHELGWGNIGDSLYKLYSGPVDPESIYGDDLEEYLKSILLFGDDYTGVNSGFIPAKNWIVVEVEPIHRRIRFMAMTFEQYIRSMIFIDS